MKKIFQYKVVSPDNSNPYRKGSFKQILMQWALDRGEFTKSEFLEAVLLLKNEYELTSKMSDEVLPGAWWNEFKNKHEVFAEVE